MPVAGCSNRANDLGRDLPPQFIALPTQFISIEWTINTWNAGSCLHWSPSVTFCHEQTNGRTLSSKNIAFTARVLICAKSTGEIFDTRDPTRVFGRRNVPRCDQYLCRYRSPECRAAFILPYRCWLSIEQPLIPLERQVSIRQNIVAMFWRCSPDEAKTDRCNSLRAKGRVVEQRKGIFLLITGIFSAVPYEFGSVHYTSILFYL